MQETPQHLHIALTAVAIVNIGNNAEFSLLGLRYEVGNGKVVFLHILTRGH
jgi:hypothetical protein